MVHELFSSVLQEICDEVSEVWARREVVEHARIPWSGLMGGSAGMWH